MGKENVHGDIIYIKLTLAVKFDRPGLNYCCQACLFISVRKCCVPSLFVY